ncbi:MAG: superoxide dismutase [Alphaproteobacteria bacterium]|nr:superoxide dismutase [Alphaproteobacteria bacterium]
MSFKLPELPYDLSALEPHISARTLEFHYGKHHQGYVTKLNELVQGQDLENFSLEEIIKRTAGDNSKIAIFNNAAQVWNHTFYWHCMTPQGSGLPSPAIKAKIDDSFGNLEQFKKEFKEAAMTQFGSGWAWLIADQGKLKIIKTGNADLPLAHGQHALLTCDVWEHAYYLDYQNRRMDYVDIFMNQLINWDFVEQNYTHATKA